MGDIEFLCDFFTWNSIKSFKILMKFGFKILAKEGVSCHFQNSCV